MCLETGDNQFDYKYTSQTQLTVSSLALQIRQIKTSLIIVLVEEILQTWKDFQNSFLSDSWKFYCLQEKKNVIRIQSEINKTILETGEGTDIFYNIFSSF